MAAKRLPFKKPKPKAQTSYSPYHLSFLETKIDLHIENLVESHRGLSNYEIVTIQLQAFQNFLDNAIVHHQKYLVAIHGVGKGVLRQEIHKMLRNHKEVASFKHQYHPFYGLGATEIYLK
ncbi:MAG: hypothetical protein CRN43_09330 [Candidatus Nephrothrix sp. EaCA]|nr:MAG: hypothetical protein CRN43_09330 [Candidatus Nephrothrix sp. EaCA]